MEQYLALIQDNIRPGIVKPKIGDDIEFKINGNFMKELRRKLFKGIDDEDAHEHVRRVLEIADLFHFPGVTHDAVMLRVFPITLKVAALRWKNTTTKERINDFSDNVDTKKLKENIHAIKVSCKICEMTHLTKECPLKKEDEAVEQSSYSKETEFKVTLTRIHVVKMLLFGRNHSSYAVTDAVTTYFQILLEPADQEKNTFTFSYGTYAYKRMPFGHCNAPATFQRCMIAVFQDMLEIFMEVFIDDFSVFGNSFDSCLGNLEQMLI
ncbi:oligopeptide transporter [Tanacetum coccineum]